jgi:hypothetical protein
VAKTVRSALSICRMNASGLAVKLGKSLNDMAASFGMTVSDYIDSASPVGRAFRALFHGQMRAFLTPTRVPTRVSTR